MFLVYDKNMNLIPFPDGAKPLDIFISSMEKERISDRAEGSNRKINYGSTYADRDIELKILLKAHDTMDYRLLRNEIYAMFSINDVMYVSESHERGKRYLISVDERYIPERYNNNQRYAEATINCSLPELPYAESIGTTQDIHQRGINADDALWGFGMGLIADDASLVYTHNMTPSAGVFIYNAGNVPIHPYEQELKITIDNVQGSSSYLQLRNNTTGDTFRTIEAVNSNQTIVLDGPNVTSNGLQYYRKTNHQFITLAPGWNEFTITGASSTRVAFDFKFYYR